MGWYKKNSSNQTHNVGQKRPNDWKLYDLSGNVWEWCNNSQPIEDLDAYTYQANFSNRSRRGGGYKNQKFMLTVTNSRSIPPTRTQSDLGFRCLRSFFKETEKGL